MSFCDAVQVEPAFGSVKIWESGETLNDVVVLPASSLVKTDVCLKQDLKQDSCQRVLMIMGRTVAAPNSDT